MKSVVVANLTWETLHTVLNEMSWCNQSASAVQSHWTGVFPYVRIQLQFARISHSAPNNSSPLEFSHLIDIITYFMVSFSLLSLYWISKRADDISHLNLGSSCKDSDLCVSNWMTASALRGDYLHWVVLPSTSYLTSDKASRVLLLFAKRSSVSDDGRIVQIQAKFFGLLQIGLSMRLSSGWCATDAIVCQTATNLIVFISRMYPHTHT